MIKGILLHVLKVKIITNEHLNKLIKIIEEVEIDIILIQD
jgi:hypothetical protein